MSDNAFTKDEQVALAMYAIAGRDIEDFLDMVSDADTTLESLRTLHAMCVTGGRAGSDADLNRLISSVVERAIAKRLTK